MSDETPTDVDGIDVLGLEETKLTAGVYRVVDDEMGKVVYYSVFDGEVTGIDAEPIED